MNFTCDNLSVGENGHLFFAGRDTAELAARYGTPLYLMDEDNIRRSCRLYIEAFRRFFPAGSRPLYASKACAFKQLYRIVGSEGMGVDVVSAGEIYTAAAAGTDMSDAYFHSNNKTDSDIAYAMEKGVGCFVADSSEELCAIDSLAGERGARQKVLLRLTPGIDPHTYAAVDTGRVDSKFGVAIETGQARELVGAALKLGNIDLAGFHCHVGSQVFGEDVFERAAVVMLEFIAEMNALYGYRARELDLGGGFGVRYTERDAEADISGRLETLAGVINAACTRLGIEAPAILIEPGRSIVAAAGLTLYTVGAVKHITGYKNYVSVDGGMTDNPRYALYGSQYSCYCADRMDEDADMPCDLVGRCCESGDVIQPNVTMPSGIRRGNLVAVCTTGAYNYSMASNYNRIPRPPVVMLRGGESGESYIAVRRETVEDVAALDNEY